MSYKVLAINPGSTSTKVGLFENRDKLLELSISHTSEELAVFPDIASQFSFRKELVLEALAVNGFDYRTLDAVIGRGGLIKPIPSGVYEVNDTMAEDLGVGLFGQHASNLGGLIARDIADAIGVHAYIADPVVVDELDDVARLTGHPAIGRVSIFHALNQKAMGRMYAAGCGRKYEDMNLIIAHMGGGVSVGAHRRGKVVDVNNALDGEGPFGPERSGSLPWGAVVDLCFSGLYDRYEVRRMFCGKGGFVAHLDTNNTTEIIRRVSAGDARARLVLEAMCYNVSKWICAMAATLCGDVDSVILTGGIAHNDFVNDYIRKRISWVAPVAVLPGENELEALAENALRVLSGETEVKIYA